MKNDKGFTLIELIVVIAIIGILSGVMSYSINSVSSTRAKKVASDLNALLSQCRVETLSGSPSPTYLKIHRESDGLYGTLYEGGTADTDIKADQKLGGGNISCSFIAIKNEEDGTTTSTTYNVSDNTLYLAFERSTGVFKNLDSIGVTTGLAGCCTVINITSGAGNYTIHLVAGTGYHYID